MKIFVSFGGTLVENHCIKLLIIVTRYSTAVREALIGSTANRYKNLKVKRAPKQNLNCYVVDMPNLGIRMGFQKLVKYV